MHHDELDLSEWDRPPAPGGPALRLAICSTPRSGSYLLCRQMINAGIGLPTEYFRERTVRTLGERWGVPRRDDDAYLDALESRRTTGNGVFAAKVQWQQLRAHPRVRERLLERADLIVFLYRRDLLAQAVSWQVSLATGFWSFDATPGPRAPDVDLEDPRRTLALAAELRRENDAWSALVGELRRRVLVVPYEAFVRDQTALLRRIAADLGLPEGSWTPPPPEGRDHRPSDDLDAARARLHAAARAAAAPAASAKG